VDLREQPISWEGGEATSTLAVDVSRWKELQRNRDRLLERYEQELLSLQRISQGRQRVQVALPATQSMQQVHPELLDALKPIYERLLSEALEQRVFKVDHDISGRLRNVAQQLYENNATPRDVVELHFNTLKRLIPDPESPRAQGLLEIGRLTIVELMGYVLTGYRNRLLDMRAGIA
jgi:hypothetical protein